MDLKEQAEEYLDCLVTAELAFAMARKFREKENNAVKNCCSAMLQRIRCNRNYQVFDGLRRQPFPSGALAMMRRQLDNAMNE